MTKMVSFATSLKTAQKIAGLGGRLFLVGGAVRDAFMGKAPHDHDFVVTGLTVDKFKEAFGNPPMTGNLFPVFRLMIGDEECEIAFARREKKTGAGHNGFVMEFDPSIGIEDDLIRRDATMNAIAVDVLSGEVIDPFGGCRDIERRMISAVSEHFVEDPLRALRVARQAAVFGFGVDDRTLRLMSCCAEELRGVPDERVWGELRKALMSERPSVFFRVLSEGGVLGCCFPELEALIGQTQPAEFHPEGDAFEHTMLVIDKVASMNGSLEARFDALFHDVGKGLTPKELLPKHHGHDRAGAELIRSWNSSRFPAKLRKSAEMTAKRHMKAILLPKMKSGTVLELLESIRKSCSLDAFRTVVEADSGERFRELSDEFCDEVFGKVAIPDKLIHSKDGNRIREFVRQERTRRIRTLRKRG